ncbi:hypothetical protein M0R45_001910 [Rubus argutus]|uniref:Uncharacterized protein n=1 Tax=Rubus argutus TaxID=59490 RepID=A0AAW1VE85_RUBAR
MASLARSIAHGITTQPSQSPKFLHHTCKHNQKQKSPNPRTRPRRCSSLAVASSRRRAQLALTTTRAQSSIIDATTTSPCSCQRPLHAQHLTTGVDSLHSHHLAQGCRCCSYQAAPPLLPTPSTSKNQLCLLHSCSLQQLRCQSTPTSAITITVRPHHHRAHHHHWRPSSLLYT